MSNPNRKKDEVKESLRKGIVASCNELMEDIAKGSSAKLARLVDFYACKAHKWSANNLMAVLSQKPEIGKPVTLKEARKLSHFPNSDAKPAYIFVPGHRRWRCEDERGIEAGGNACQRCRLRSEVSGMVQREKSGC